MTTFPPKARIDLAIAAVVAPIASYGLNRLFPAPDAHFIVIAITVASLIETITYTLGEEYASKLTRKYVDSNTHRKSRNQIFYHLNSLFSTGIYLLLPIFARYVGQRMGIQVPGYLQTVGYYTLAGCAVAISRNIRDIGYAVYHLKSATNTAHKPLR